MIVDRIENYGRYLGISEEIDLALRSAFGLSPDVADGRIEFERGVYANVMTIEPAGAPNLFETHRKYLDLQLILSGEERVCFADRGALTETEPYAPVRDAAFYAGAGDAIDVPAGGFYLVFPNEAHAPGGRAGTARFRKAVFKIPYKEMTNESDPVSE